jgi:hypothetical protein
MSFEPIPEPSASSDYLRIKENEKHRIRIMGTSKDPATFVQGWEAWGDDNKPHRMPYVLNQPCPKELRDLDRDGKPKLFWMFTVWHVELEKPMVFEVTQQTIKNQILSYSSNPKWGDPSCYVLEIGRTGTGMETVYTVIAEPPVEAPAKAITDAMTAAAIDVRVVFDDGSPFGALVVDDQVNIQELRDAGEPIPMPKRKPVDDNAETVHSVGSITRDAIQTLKDAQEKQQSVAPEMKDGMPY